MDLKGLKGILSVNKGILELKDKAGLQKIMMSLFMKRYSRKIRTDSLRFFF